MSAFTINTITIQGINIIAKLIAGSTLEFTKIELGDGQLQGINPQSVTALTNTVVTLPITGVSAADGTATVTGVFTNKDLNTGFFYRELGLFAKDPETGEEKLYCYGNAENNAEWIPPSGTETVVEKKIKINTICGNATKVTATLASGIYVTKETVDQEIEIHNKDLGAHEVLFGEYTYYVNGATGNDANPGTEDKPLKTINKAVELIPSLAKAATVNIAAGTYNESVIISDKVRGKLSFIGADKETTKVTSLKADGNMYLCLMKLTFNSNGTPLRTVEMGCGTVSFSECKFIGNGASHSMGVAIHRANGIVYNCDFTGFNFGLMAAYGSGIFAYYLHCSNNTYDLYSNGGFIATDDNTTLTKFSDYGGIISSYAVGKSIAAGVADSITAVDDSSKKIALTEWVRLALTDGITNLGTEVQNYITNLLKSYTTIVSCNFIGSSKYIRYSDGLQICFGATGTPSGYNVYAAFAVPFIDTEYEYYGVGSLIPSDPKYDSVVSVMDSYNKSTTTCFFRTKYETGPAIKYFAIGRWK